LGQIANWLIGESVNQLIGGSVVRSQQALLSAFSFQLSALCFASLFSAVSASSAFSKAVAVVVVASSLSALSGLRGKCCFCFFRGWFFRVPAVAFASICTNPASSRESVIP
jgi:hypothetical protein